MNRRNFLKSSAGAALLASAPLSAADNDSAMPEYQKPVFDLHKTVATPVKIASIDLLKSGKTYFLRTRSTDGAEGVIQTKDIEDYISILQRRVIPDFLGKDARDLETLVDDVYIAHYKLAGQAFWCPVAYVEQSLFDLMGKTVKKPAGELMGGVLRKEIPVYLSGSGRDDHRRGRGGRLRARRGVYRRQGGEVQDRRPHERQSGRLSRPHRQDCWNWRRRNSRAK